MKKQCLDNGHSNCSRTFLNFLVEPCVTWKSWDNEPEVAKQRKVRGGLRPNVFSYAIVHTLNMKEWPGVAHR